MILPIYLYGQPVLKKVAEDIDADRVERSYHRAQNVLGNKDATSTDITLAEARLKRALVRRSVVSFK